jgi:hypothetical protein
VREVSNPVNYIALLGAGFSRNWGGWLAAEVFEYLIGCTEVDANINNLLWKFRNSGGFEAALGELQGQYLRTRSSSVDEPLERLQRAIFHMFADMDKAFEGIQFEFQSQREFSVAKFLTRFDAIFTLNQDLLLERYYVGENVALLSDGRWSGGNLPGMIPPSATGANPTDRYVGRWRPDPCGYSLHPTSQPIIKLHGSSNWVDGNDRALLVMGGNKPEVIKQHPILKWNHEQFRAYLARPNARLMVIGYSFSDEHVNNAITSAMEQKDLRVFVIDPLGADVLDRKREENRRVAIQTVDPLLLQVRPYLIGASRRSLREIFGSDMVEHGKVMRFFA